MTDCDCEGECRGGGIVTMMDVLKDQEDYEKSAYAMLNACDDKECTYSKGYLKRQVVFVCLTCSTEAKDDPTKRAGICLACTLHCHETHEIIELYTKRNFRCDCGNPKFNGTPCNFTPSKTELNEDNVYNQNYSGLYCTCHRPYPDPTLKTNQDMFQCIICEDWLHSIHLEAPIPVLENASEMICKACMDKNEFLHDYTDMILKKVDTTNESSDESPSTDIEDGNINGEVGVDLSKKSNNNDMSKDHPVKMEVNSENVTDDTKELKECDTTLKSTTEQVHEASLSDQNQNKNEDVTTQALEDDSLSKENKDVIEKQDALPDLVLVGKEPTASQSHSSKDELNTQTSAVNIDVQEEQDNLEHENSVQPILNVAEESSNQQTNCNKTEGEILQPTKNEGCINEKEDTIENKELTQTDSLVAEQPTDDQMISNEQENINTQDSIKNDDSSQQDEFNKEQTTNEQTVETKSNINQENIEPSNGMEKDDSLNQEKVQEDLLLGDPMEVDMQVDVAISKTDSDESVVKVKSETEIESMDTSQSVSDTEQLIENTADSINEQEINNATCDLQNENNTNITDNTDIQKDDTKAVSNDSIDVPGKVETDAEIVKRKLNSDDENNISPKKPKLNESTCIRPRGVQKVHYGSTFWPSNMRQRLCTCSECLSMYKDLSVSFLVDADDTVQAFERLGRDKNGGKPLTQYEKGMQALSTLGRVQQIDALTEYANMRDKLLEYLKSFKERKVVVKEEDIKAFFAGMKPVRKPDGVYFRK